MKTNIVLIALAILSFGCEKREFTEKIIVETGSLVNKYALYAEVTGTIVTIGEGITDHGHVCIPLKTLNPDTARIQTHLGASEGTTKYTSLISGLQPATQYKVWSFATDGHTTAYGDTLTFYTQYGKVILNSVSMKFTDITTVELMGSIYNDGSDTINWRGFVLSRTNSDPTIESNDIMLTVDDLDADFIAQTEIEPGYMYYCRAFAKNKVSMAYTDAIDFIAPQWGTAFFELTNGNPVDLLAVDGYYFMLSDNGYSDKDPNDVFFTKFDNSGKRIWKKTYTGLQTGRVNSTKISQLCSTNEGDFIMVGNSYTVMDSQISHHGSSDIIVIKTDEYGNMQWSKNYGGTGLEYGNSVVQCVDDGFLLGGITDSPEIDSLNYHGSWDYVAIRINNSGEILWQKRFGGNDTERFNNLINCDDGNYLLVGSSESSNGDVGSNYGSDDIWVVKISDDGELIWEKNYGGSGQDYPIDYINLKDGNYLIQGNTRSVDGDIKGSHGGSDIWVIKIDDDGNLSKQRCFGNEDDNYASSVLQIDDENFYLMGSRIYKVNFYSGKISLNVDMKTGGPSVLIDESSFVISGSCPWSENWATDFSITGYDFNF